MLLGMIRESFFQAVQKACLPGIWSKGVQLSRSSDSVIRDSSSLDLQMEDEVILRVRSADHPVSRKVTLWQEDEDWYCDCEYPSEVCFHVVAAVVALKNGRAVSATDSSSSTSVAQIHYRLNRVQENLSFERWIVQGAQKEEMILRDSLVSFVGGVTSGRIRSRPVAATQADYAIDSLLGERKWGEFSQPILLKLFRGLSGCSHLFLDGSPIAISSQPQKIIVRLIDEGRGFRLQQVEDPTITETFKNGAVLCGSTLKAVELPHLSPEELQWLRGRGTHFGLDRTAFLITEVLPALEKKISVQILTRNLPSLEKTPPRIVLELERVGNTDLLSVLPRITYGQAQVYLPDLFEERALTQKLQMELQLVPGQRMQFRGAEAVEFCQRIQNWETRGNGRAAFASVGTLRPQIDFPKIESLGRPVSSGQKNDDRFELDFRLDTASGGSPVLVESESVLRAWRENQNYFPLLDGSWAALPQDWLNRYGERVAALLAARSEGQNSRRPVPAHQLPELLDLCEEAGQPFSESLRRLKEQFDRMDLIADVPLPVGLQASLRTYQQKGVNWLCFLRDSGMGALLADDMGLGKTLQALCAVRGRTLIVAPTSVLQGWAGQIQQFRPDISFIIYHGGSRVLNAVEPAAGESETQIVLTTYALFRLDRVRILGEKWDTVILDEAQTIKNPDSQVARIAHQIRADFRVALSGTPIENRLEDLWSQLQFLNPGLLGTLEEFRGLSREVIQKRIRPFILRRLKKEVAPELPPRTEITLYCELSEPERESYEAILASSRNEALQKLRQGSSVFAVLELLLRLRQACCHPALVPGGNVSVSGKPQIDKSAKVELLLQTLESSIALGHRALVFSQWTSFLDLIEPCLREKGISFSRLDGATQNRQVIVEEFQTTKGPSVMLISLKAGGTGLTLTAADHVFLMDPWWNPTVEDQAADRAHRIGQTNPVLIHRLIASGTIEEQILNLQKFKVGLASSILEGSMVQPLNREDLLALLESH